MKKPVVIILLITLLIISAIGCIPNSNEQQLARIEAELKALSSALASTQQELASTKLALAEAQDKAMLLQQQLMASADLYVVKTVPDTVSTATSAPVIVSFTVSPNIVSVGQASTLQWNVTGANSISISPNVGTVSSSGTLLVYPSASTTYILSATNSYGMVTAYATITAESYRFYYSNYPYPPRYMYPMPPFPYRPPPPPPPFSDNHTPPPHPPPFPPP
jgi:hypothetical protein